MPKTTVLVVDDDDLLCALLRRRLTLAGHNVLEALTGQRAVELYREGVDLVLLDLQLPDADGLDVMRRIKASDPSAVVIPMSAYGTIERAVEAMQLGAFHYARKPLDLGEIARLVERGLDAARHRREPAPPRAKPRDHGVQELVGESPVMRSVKTLLAKVARCASATVLVTGESGTGKDLAAKAIHVESERRGAPFMNITCSALTETLLESELFGYERGAFTDAKQRKKGLLELADGGTVFLDEVGEMTPALQAKLLRFLEERAFKRVGGATDVRVDVRIIAATNRDLTEAVRTGGFREDLYFRLNVLPVRMPPLRDRAGDVPLLVETFVGAFSRGAHRRFREVRPEAMRALEAYHWPGNVRELRNTVERAVLLADSDVLDVSAFGGALPARGPTSSPFRLPVEGVDFQSLERDFVVQALEYAEGNQSRAATLLGMNRDQIRYRIEKFGLRENSPPLREIFPAPPPRLAN